MNITLIETKGPDDFEIPELKKRAQESSTGPITKHYKALAHNQEVAFVSLERWLELNQMVICNIFVPLSTRQQKFAIAVLNEVERIAACEGLSDVRFMPSSIDSPFNNIDWCKSRGYVVYSSNPMILFKTIGFNHWEAYDKFSKAIYILATGSEDVRSRLLAVWQHSLRGLADEQLPEDLRKNFVWIKKQLHKYHEKWHGQLNDLKQQEKRDHTFKDKYAHLYPNPVEATLQRIRKKTGAGIAQSIYNIYDALKSLRC